MKKSIAVLHPDLGIGGAERLILDVCIALKNSGHQVKLFTGFHDKSRCFEETIDKSLNVITVGQWIPRSIFGQFHALQAYLKMMYIAIYLIFFQKFDVVICDQVSACIPILKLNLVSQPKIIFYCHFPDLLLVQKKSFLRSIYRWPLNYFEELTTSMAHSVVVNSEFTASVVRRTFKRLKNRHLVVLHPIVDVKKFYNFKSGNLSGTDLDQKLKKIIKMSKDDTFIFLSVNRFERKKNLNLAISAFKKFKLICDERSKGPVMKAHLIMAGGYDDRLKDCVGYYSELEDEVTKFELANHVTFIQNPSETEKLLLLQTSHVVVYTPENEHFGIVPLEAMAMSKPVVAVGSGGVLETVVDNRTGLLCGSSDDSQFGDAMYNLFEDRIFCGKLGNAGFKRVSEHFSLEAFQSQLDKICFA